MFATEIKLTSGINLDGMTFGRWEGRGDSMSLYVNSLFREIFFRDKYIIYIPYFDQLTIMKKYFGHLTMNRPAIYIFLLIQNAPSKCISKDARIQMTMDGSEPCPNFCFIRSSCFMLGSEVCVCHTNI